MRKSIVSLTAGLVVVLVVSTGLRHSHNAQPLKENIKTSLKISNLAHKYNISVEGEIGEVGYFKGKNSKGTDTHEAKEYASKSKIDAICVEGKSTKKLDDIQLKCNKNMAVKNAHASIQYVS